MKIRLRSALFAMLLCFLCGICVACGIMLREGTTHFPDFWTATCK